jgi:hypothetical protein
MENVEGSWLVEDYQDVVRFKSKKDIERMGRYRMGQPLKTFPTQAEAFRFIRERAQLEVEKAEKNLERAKRNMRKCENKFGFRIQATEIQL